MINVLTPWQTEVYIHLGSLTSYAGHGVWGGTKQSTRERKHGQGLSLSFFRYLSKGQVNLYFTCPRAQVTFPNTTFLYKHYIWVQITNVIAIDLIMMYPLFKTYCNEVTLDECIVMTVVWREGSEGRVGWVNWLLAPDHWWAWRSS